MPSPAGLPTSSAVNRRRFLKVSFAGSAAVFRIKEEMLVRATEVSGAGMVKDILIQDLVQQ